MWHVELLLNEPKITSECAKEIFDVQCYKDTTFGDLFVDPNDVLIHGFRLYFNPDSGEHIDYVCRSEIKEILKKYKVKGKICFGQLEGDGGTQFWGYDFDGKGNVKELSGEIIWS